MKEYRSPGKAASWRGPKLTAQRRATLLAVQCGRTGPLGPGRPERHSYRRAEEEHGRVPRRLRLPAVESRDEHDLIPVLELVVELPLEFPVGVIDKNKNAGTAVASAVCRRATIAATYTPSPSANMSSRSVTRCCFIHAIRKRMSAGRASPGTALGRMTECLGCWEKMRCKPPLCRCQRELVGHAVWQSHPNSSWISISSDPLTLAGDAWVRGAAAPKYPSPLVAGDAAGATVTAAG